MTRDPFVDPQDDRLAEFFDEARAALVEAPTPAVERRHLAAMVEAFEASDVRRSTAPRRRRLMNRILALGAVKALAVAFAALIATGSALAAAGSLPDPAQDAVANTVDNVGLNIPGGDDETQVAETDEQNEQEDADDQEEANENEDGDTDQAGEPQGPPARATTADCPGFTGNHGEYVSGTEEGTRSDAAHSDCGKPEHAVDDGEGEQEEGEQGESAEHRKDGQEHGENEQEHGQGGPTGESSGEGS